MRLRASLLALVLAAALPASAQTPAAAAPRLTRDDAIRALLAGDYQTAVSVLRPLAEESEPPDPVAQFFMGLLYYSNIGVRGDPFHACSLFLSAAAVENPFAETAARFSRSIQEQMPGPFCTRVWSVPRAATFELGPNHRVALTRTETTISFNGLERVIPAPESNPSIMFEPSVYAFVDVPGPVPLRRHFIESFLWLHQVSGPALWILVWNLHEVVGLDYIDHPFDPNSGLDVVTTSEASREVDVSQLVNLHARSDGSVDFTVGHGSDEKRGTIPPLEGK